jgi:hypothetical protein
MMTYAPVAEEKTPLNASPRNNMESLVVELFNSSKMAVAMAKIDVMDVFSMFC